MKIEFEHHFGGQDTWYLKAERWAKKQRFPISFLLLGVIEYLKKMWIDVKIYNTMQDVDRQAEELKKHWEEHDEPITPHIVETGVFGDESWSIQISNPVVEGRTTGFESGMVVGSNAQRLQEDEGDKGTSLS